MSEAADSSAEEQATAAGLVLLPPELTPDEAEQPAEAADNPEAEPVDPAELTKADDDTSAQHGIEEPPPPEVEAADEPTPR